MLLEGESYVSENSFVSWKHGGYPLCYTPFNLKDGNGANFKNIASHK